MVNDIRIQNLRALRDTGFIKMKPLNILVGSNSSGKSTFLRAFLLLTQSVTKKLRVPLSWFDDSFVDFGDFETSKNKNADDSEPIIFSFKLTNLKENRNRFISIFFRRLGIGIQKLPNDIETSISYSIDSKKNVFVSDVTFRFDQIEATFKLPEKSGLVSIEINKQKLSNLQFVCIQQVERGLFPIIFYKTSDLYKERSQEHDMCISVLETLGKLCGKKFTHYDRLFPIIRLWNLDKHRFLEALKSFKEIISLKKNITKWTIDSPDFQNLYDGILLMHLYELWKTIDIDLFTFFENCDYVAPLRAEARRYYRNQGLQVDRVDPFGRNLTEVIDSLTETQRNSFNDFIEKVLSIRLVVRNISGHQTIMLKRGNREFNMADVGFGYSQILPIITKLWSLRERSRFSSFGYYKVPVVTSLIEQPELHLHPALQAKLADTIMKVAIGNGEENNVKTDFIIETHSPTFINRIGRRIREGFFHKEDVNILIFNKNHENGDSIVKPVEFDNSGRITNWPFGFFDPEDDDF